MRKNSLLFLAASVLLFIIFPSSFKNIVVSKVLAQIQMQPFYPSATPTPIGGVPATNTPAPIGSATNTPTPRATNTPAPAAQNTVECLVNAVSEQSIRSFVENLVDNDATPARDESQSRYSRGQGNITEGVYIRGVLTGNGLATSMQAFDEPCPTGNVASGNSIGILQGSSIPQETYLVTSHMDSISPNPLVAPGADDNGSGTALVLEAARVFRVCNFTPKRSIEFITFSGEEQGLLGSTYYVRDYVQNKRATKTIKGVLNVDMIGTASQGNHIFFTYNPIRPGQLLAQKVIDMKNKYHIPLEITLKTNSENRSDHAAFHAQNIPAAFGYEYTFSNVYHSVNDKPSNPNYSYTQIALTTKAVVAALAELANE